MKGEKITIKEIARRTGLSTGTVDRVLHNRGEVSGKSREKVMEAIRELGYEPNVHASLLSSGKRVRIVVLIPSPESGPFWSISAQGIERAAESTSVMDVSLSCVTYDQADLESFREAGRKVLDMGPSGVVLAPMFRYESFRLTQELHNRGIPYVFIDSKLEHDGYLAYCGMPAYESGYLCADQLTGSQPIDSALIVRVASDRHGQAGPTAYRRSGFLDYIAEHSPGCALSQVTIDPEDPARTDEILDQFDRTHPGVRHIVMFNSRIHLIVPWLERHPVPGRRVIGFDNLDANVEALKAGTVSVLIAQHPDEQVAFGIQTLSDYILLGKEPAHRDNFMHMDILTRYNVSFY